MKLTRRALPRPQRYRAAVAGRSPAVAHLVLVRREERHLMSTATLYGITLLVSLAVCVSTAGAAFWLWRRYKFPFVLFFAFASLLDILSVLWELAAWHNPLLDSEYATLMDALRIVYIISSLIFVTGLALLVRHVQKAGFSHHVPPSDAP